MLLENLREASIDYDLGRRRVIAIEGPNCVGKSFLTKELAKRFSFRVHRKFIPPVDRMMILGDMLAIHDFADRIIIDRTFLSWSKYNYFDEEMFHWWLKSFSSTDSVLICLDASVEKILELASKKGEIIGRERIDEDRLWFEDMYRRFSGDFKISYFLDHNDNMVDDIYNQIQDYWRGRGF